MNSAGKIVGTRSSLSPAYCNTSIPNCRIRLSDCTVRDRSFIFASAGSDSAMSTITTPITTITSMIVNAPRIRRAVLVAISSSFFFFQKNPRTP